MPLTPQVFADQVFAPYIVAVPAAIQQAFSEWRVGFAPYTRMSIELSEVQPNVAMDRSRFARPAPWPQRRHATD